MNRCSKILVGICVFSATTGCANTFGKFLEVVAPKNTLGKIVETINPQNSPTTPGTVPVSASQPSTTATPTPFAFPTTFATPTAAPTPFPQPTAQITPSPAATPTPIAQSSFSAVPSALPTTLIAPSSSSTPLPQQTLVSTPSPTPSLIVLPNPSNLKVNLWETNRLVLSWDNVTGAQFYEIRMNDMNGQLSTFKTSSSTYDFKSLNSGSRYTFSILTDGKANSLGTLLTTYTVPTPPVILSKRSSTSSTISINIQASNDGAAQTGWLEYEIILDGVSIPKSHYTYNRDLGYIVIFNLNPNQSYNIQAKSVIHDPNADLNPDTNINPPASGLSNTINFKTDLS